MTDMFRLNTHAVRRAYDVDLQPVLSLAEGRAARDRLSTWSGLADHPTPQWPLPGLARTLGVASLTVKDESKRSSLGSFKALGAPNALIKLVLRRWPRQGWSAADLLAGRHAQALKNFVVISATDGNHGRALAAAARSIGCRCVIVLHAHVSDERTQAIAAFGAEIVRITGNYDESVSEAARLADVNGWEVVSDTSYEGYQEVPRDVIQGYGVIAEELLENAADAADAAGCPWTHVILQGGVGGMAAGIASCFWDRYGERRPHFIVVEPEQADCLLQSAIAGRPARAQGSVDSVMAGLACGETSPLAWRFLQPAVDLFLTVSDAQAEAAMRVLAEGSYGDVPIVAGESGVAGLAALQDLMHTVEGRHAAVLDAQSRVLLINTEGATAPGVYAGIVGRPATDVLTAQSAWLAHHGLSQERLMERLQAHACIGAIDGGGVCRIALTDADKQGRDQLVSWMKQLNLEVRIDRIGNIEQGPVMEAEGIEIGAVENLQGISWQEFTLTGQSNHAGTTPMRLRRDAGYCAAAIGVRVRELAQRYGGSQVATVGAINLHPNLINVIAARATVMVDLRNTDETTLQRAEQELADFVQRLSTEQSVTIEARRLARFEPVRFDERLVRLIEASARARGHRTRRMTSGAGHDAQMMARICPFAMIFVPSVNGISHNPREHTEPVDLARGANVLLDTVLTLAAER